MEILISNKTNKTMKNDIPSVIFKSVREIKQWKIYMNYTFMPKNYKLSIFELFTSFCYKKIIRDCQILVVYLPYFQIFRKSSYDEGIFP